MTQRYKLKNHVHVEHLEDDVSFFLTDGDYRVLQGQIYPHLLPLLDGQHSDTDMMMKLSGKVHPPQIWQALGRLGRNGLLTHESDRFRPNQSAYFQAVGVGPNDAYLGLSKSTVSVQAIGDATAEALTSALRQSGVTINPSDSADVKIVITDDYMRPEIAAINAKAIEQGQRWILVKNLGRILWVGPAFQPSDTACWACMAQRIGGNRQVETYIQRNQKASAPLQTSQSALPTTKQLGIHMVVNEIVKWLSGKNNLANTLLTLDTATMMTQRHSVIKRPQCKKCGEPTAAESAGPVPFTLQPQPKRFTRDGGHRTCLPEETYERYKEHISPITGVVSSLVSRIGINGLTYSYTAGHNFAMWDDDMTTLSKNLRSQSGGKGRTKIQAQVSGICEAIERYSGVYREPHPHAIQASYAELGDKAIHPYEILQFSPEQYETRHAWNHQLDAPFNIVTNPFDENQSVEWLPLTSLTNNTLKYVAGAHCFYGHTDLNKRFCGSDSNGCAAGNVAEEAILQGFLELAERDAVAIWWYSRIALPGVDVASFNMPYFHKLKAHYASQGRSFWVIDLTNDLGVYAFAALSARIDDPTEDIIMGFGAHLDAKLAIMRAMTEVNQFLPSVAHKNPDGTTDYRTDAEAIKWFKSGTLASDPYLAANPNVPLRTAADYPDLSSADLRDDVMTCVRSAEEVGLETFVLDQTLPDIGLSVFRVMVPGLRHFWRRLRKGRLFDVPVKLGWLDAPLSEAELNKHSMFF